MKPVETVEQAVDAIRTHRSGPENFVLVVPDVLLDPVGINMARITDQALARGWQPDGFTAKAGHREYRYKSFDA